MVKENGTVNKKMRNACFVYFVPFAFTLITRQQKDSAVNVGAIQSMLATMSFATRLALDSCLRLSKVSAG